jgi:3-deoxy-D-manno-octulosonic-acid transferase
LGVFFYNLFILLFQPGIHLAALFNPKAKKWVKGRVGILEKIEAAVKGRERIIWVHCASLGEFEQGRPVIERLRETAPHHRILLTFFSPSGYEVRKNYAGADWVFYLPLDGPRTAKRFLDAVQPVLVIFVKYEFWYYYLKKLKYRNTPLLLISALFWEKMSFFKWYGAMQRKMLSRFDHLFVQNEESLTLMKRIGLENITTVSGDTRFDRVIDIAEKAGTIPMIEEFVKDSRILVAGSTWPEDERVLADVLTATGETALKLIIAPHEITEKHLSELKALFPGALFYSELTADTDRQMNSGVPRVLIIDNIGLLSRLYRYAYITYVGGGFGKGIHNTLEAAVYGKPVLFGPVYHKFQEAADLLAVGAATSIRSADEAIARVMVLSTYENEYKKACDGSRNYVYGKRGATGKIIRYIQEKRLLTS